MLPATQFFAYWGLAFLTLVIALALLSIFYRLIDADLGLRTWRKEVIIALIASSVQGAGLWFTASLIRGGFGRQVIPGIAVWIIYVLTHLGEWSGYEMAGIFLFQTVIWALGTLLIAGDYQIAVVVGLVFLASLIMIARIAKSL